MFSFSSQTHARELRKDLKVNHATNTSILNTQEKLPSVL